MKQTEARTLYREFAEHIAKKAGVNFTPTNKKELFEYLEEMINEDQFIVTFRSKDGDWRSSGGVTTKDRALVKYNERLEQTSYPYLHKIKV